MMLWGQRLELYGVPRQMANQPTIIMMEMTHQPKLADDCGYDVLQDKLQKHTMQKRWSERL